MNKIVYLLVLIFFCNSVVFSQKIAMDNTITPAAAVNNVLLGAGVVATNIKYNGVALNALSTQPNIGSFTGGTTVGFPYNTGVVMSTNGATGIALSDVDLNAISSGVVKNGAIIEFDFVAVGDTLSFKYIFASTEYGAGYACSDYNDVFGFFLSGPGIAGTYSNGGINLAKIPNKNVAVSINTVNAGVVGASGAASYCSALDALWTANSIYFTNANDLKYNFNGGSSALATENFDGGTVSLPVKSMLQCGQTYHIKLVIANVGDEAFNSGVFLEGGSFSTGAVKADFATTGVVHPFGDDVLVAGCNSRRFVFRRPNSNMTNPLSFTYATSGTAILNTDYTLSTSGIIIIPAGQDTVGINIMPINGGPLASMKTIVFRASIVGSTCTGNLVDSVKIYLLAPPVITVIGTTSPTLCGGTDGTISMSFTNVANGTYTLNYNNGTTKTITITGGVGTLTGMAAGTYLNIYFNNAECKTGPTAIIIAPIPVISSQISSATGNVCLGGTFPTLTIVGSNITSYQWYSNTSASTVGATLIPSATASTYVPSSAVSGTLFYYCVLTNACGSVTSAFSGSMLVNPISVGGTVSANQTICSGSTPADLTLTGNIGSITKWQKATNAAFTGAVDIANTTATLSGVSIGALTATTYFRAVITSGVCTSANSASAIITVDPTSVGGTVSANQTICSGSTPANLILTGNTGSVTKWQKATNSSFTGATDIANNTITLTGVSIGALTATTYFRAVVTSGTCSSANSAYVTITVDPTSVGGTVTANQTICSGSTPADLTLSGNIGTVTKWQKATNSLFTGAVDIANTSTTLTGVSIGALTVTTYFRAVVTSGTCSSANSALVIITVDPTSVGGTVSSDQTICTGTIPANLTLGGNVGTVTKWQKATNAAFTGAVDIANTSITLTGVSIGALTATTYFRAVVTSGTCSSANSAYVTITINENTLITSQATGSQIICSSSNFTPISVTASGTALTYQWYSNTISSIIGGTLIPGATSNLYTPVSASLGDLYYYCVVNGGCGLPQTSAVSGVMTVNPGAAPISSQSTSTQKICLGYTFNAISVVAVGSSITYQWFINTVPSYIGGVSLGAAGQSASYVPDASVVSSNYYYCEVTTDCGTQKSIISGVMVVNPTSNYITSQSTLTQTICFGNFFNSIDVVATGTGLSYQWFCNTTASTTGGINLGTANGAQTSVYTPASSVVGTLYYYCEVSGLCGPMEPSAISEAMTVNPSSNFIVSQSTAAQTICSGTVFTPISVTTLGTNLTYQWYSNTSASTTGGINLGAANGAQTSSFTPAASSIGTLYYYCEVTGLCSPMETTLISGAMVVNPTSNYIISQNTPALTICLGEVFNPISVTTVGTNLTFEWFTSGALGVPSSNVSIFTPSSATVGTFYYYCEVSSVCGAAESSAISGALIVNPTSDYIVSQSTPAQTICNGSVFNSISVTTVGTDLTYQWYSNTSASTIGGVNLGTLNGAQSNVYTPVSSVVGTLYYYCVVNGLCGAADTSLISGSIVLNDVTVIVSQVTPTLSVCINETLSSMSVTATGTGLTYQWYSNVSNSNTGGSIITGGTSSTYLPSSTVAGSLYYYCVVSGACGSPISSAVSGSIIVLGPSLLSLTSQASTTTQTVCFDSQITDIVYSYGGTATSATVSGLPAGVNSSVSGGVITISGMSSVSGSFPYIIAATGGCPISPLTGVVTINQLIPAPVVNYSIDNCIENGGSLMGASSSNGGVLEWSNTSNFSLILVTGATLVGDESAGFNTYYIHETLNGCSGEYSMIPLEFHHCNVIVPTAFTPDNDVVNDNWELANLDELYPNNSVFIYNRWGEKIYESTDGNYEIRPWDGKFHGEDLPVNSYYFIIEYNYKNKEAVKGTVTIVKKQ